MNFASLFAKPPTLLPSRLPSCDNTTTPIRVVVATLRPFCLNVLQNVHVDFLFNFVFDFHYSTPLYTPPPIPSAPPLHTQIMLTHTHTLRLPRRVSSCHIVIDIDIAQTTYGHTGPHTHTLPHCHLQHWATPATLPHCHMQLCN